MSAPDAPGIAEPTPPVAIVVPMLDEALMLPRLARNLAALDPGADTPEITEGCWGLLGLDPASVMCAGSRMVVKRRGAARPSVVACTLVPHDPGFDFGPDLAGALGAVALNHPNCVRFCVLGGASCGS